MTKVLVTGGTGFVGSHLCKRLLEQGYEVVSMQRDLPGVVQVSLERIGIKEMPVIAQGDITHRPSLQSILEKHTPDLVVHTAAQTIVKNAMKNPFSTFKTNVLGTLSVLENAEKQGVPVIHLSTDKVYGNRISATVDDCLQPVELYGISKAAADMAAQEYHACIIRCCNIFGLDFNSRIIPNTIRSCMRGERPVIYEPTKHFTRQYIYVEDVVDAILFLMDKEARGVWNVGTAEIRSQEDVVKTICSHFDIEPDYVDKKRTGKIQHQSVDWSKISIVGWRARHSFEDGIKETIEKFKKRGDLD